MKKIYTAPEAELLCFRPVEELANGVLMDNLLGENPVTGNKPAAGNGASDITIDWNW